MNLNDARQLFTEIRKELGLPDSWIFQFDNSVRRFGQCRYASWGRPGVISMSKPLVELNDAARVGQTMRHEIAHALVGPGHGHNHVWRAMSIKCGDDGQRCYSLADTIVPERPFVATCAKCGTRCQKLRMPAPHRAMSCGHCSRRFDPNNLLKFASNPLYGRRVGVSIPTARVTLPTTTTSSYVPPVKKPEVTAAVVSTIREMRAQGHGYIAIDKCFGLEGKGWFSWKIAKDFGIQKG